MSRMTRRAGFACFVCFSSVLLILSGCASDPALRESHRPAAKLSLSIETTCKPGSPLGSERSPVIVAKVGMEWTWGGVSNSAIPKGSGKP